MIHRFRRWWRHWFGPLDLSGPWTQRRAPIRLSGVVLSLDGCPVATNDIEQSDVAELDMLKGLSQQDLVLEGFFDATSSENTQWQLDKLLKRCNESKITLRIWRHPYWLFVWLEKILRRVRLGHWCYREFDITEQTQVNIGFEPTEEDKR